MKLKALSAAVAAVVLAGVSGGAAAQVTDGWTVGGYGKFKYDFGESYNRQSTWEHRRDMRAAGPFFSANVNQIEFTLKKESTYRNGARAEYVLRTEYGNNEGGNGQPYYGSSSGNEGHLETGQLEFKEAYVQLADLSFMPKDMSIWAGRRFLNRQQGLISKEFWNQSSGVGAGINFTNKMGFAFVSADPGEGSCDGVSCKENGVTDEGARTTINSANFFIHQVEALGGNFNIDAKYFWRANDDDLGVVGENAADVADDGFGISVMYATNYYGLEGWSVTALTYGEGIGSNRGVNFGQWSSAWAEDDSAWFFTSNGVLNISPTIQLGTEIAYWSIDMEDSRNWYTDTVDRLFVGVTPSFKVNDNLRIELIGSFANEKADWYGSAGSAKSEQFYTATFAPVFTVNADYFGRPQVKPYITYMKSSMDDYNWTHDGKGSETVFGVEAEIWF